MNIAIRYRAVFQYEAKASFSPHIVRLFPRSAVGTHVNRTRFTSPGSAEPQYRQDLFDNVVAKCFYPEEMERLEYTLEIDMTVEERNAFNFLLDAHVLEAPFTYKEDELFLLETYLKPRQAVERLPEALEPPRGRKVPTVEAIMGINAWLHENITYERREEGEAYAPDETLRLMQGSCRDYSVLLAEVLRRWGMASRLVSGYLWEEDLPDSPRRAENALHAWVETYVPGAGWLALDPTNGVLCDHHFIPTAVGLAPEHIPPVHGHYYGKQTIASKLDTQLAIEEVKQ